MEPTQAGSPGGDTATASTETVTAPAADLGADAPDPIEAAISRSVAEAEASGRYPGAPGSEGAAPVAAGTPAATPAPATTVAGDPAASAAKTDGAVTPPAGEDTFEAEVAAAQAEWRAAHPDADGRMSLDRHQAVLTVNRRRAEAAADARVAEVTQKYARFDTPDFKEQMAAIELAEHHPVRFVSEVLMQVPAYQQIIENMVAERVKAQPAAAAAPVTSQFGAVPDKRPEPDVVLPDGSLGYGPQASQQLLAWEMAQLTKGYESQITALKDQLKPTLEAQKHTEDLEAAKARMRPQIQRMQQWPDFNEQLPAIRKYIDDNPRSNAQDAYAHVVVGGLKAQITSLQAQVKAAEANGRAAAIAEMNAASRAGKVVPPAGQPPISAGGGNEFEHLGLDNMEAVILREMRKHQGTAA